MSNIQKIREILTNPPDNVNIVEMLTINNIFERNPYSYAETIKDIALINKYDFDINHKDKNGVNALYCVKNKNVILKLIKQGIDVYCKNKRGQTLLFNCPDNVMELFIECGLNVNDKDNEGKTPLFYANVKRAEKLINLGADIHITDNNGNTALFSGSHLKKAFLIKKGAKINHLNNHGCNALFAVEDVNSAIELINNGIDVNQISNAGKNALFVLREDICRYLLEQTKIDIQHINHNDEKATALFGVGYHKATLLIKHNININVTNYKNKNALFYTKKDKELIKLLIEHNCHVEDFLFSGKINDQELIDLMYLKLSEQSRNLLKNTIICDNKDKKVQTRI